MKKMSFAMVTMLAAVAAGAMFAGCKQKAGEPGKAGTPAAAEKAAPGADGEKAANAVAEKPVVAGTMAFLCDKLAAEQKAAMGAGFTAKVETDTRENCRLLGVTFEKGPKAKEAVAAMVNHTITACEGKSGKDWVDCYNNDIVPSGDAANKVIMGK